MRVLEVKNDIQEKVTISQCRDYQIEEPSKNIRRYHKQKVEL